MSHKNLIERYIATWNETDPTRRMDLIKQTFTENASYLDPLMAGEGYAAIDGLISGVQAQFPGHELRLIGEVDGFGDRVRCSWELVPEQGGVLIKATDFGVVVGDRLAEVTGFLDQAPAQATAEQAD